MDEEDATTEGSSPLARGLPRPGRYSERIPGIIPARAGFTRFESSPGAGARDHPRSRGVYYAALVTKFQNKGSSPLARGLPVHLGRGHRRHRIIPARAGFTEPEEERKHENTDHPRSRGVYFRLRQPASHVTGSSPLARGLPGAEEDLRAQRRIIPARAGFTAIRSYSIRPRGDHPRSRGVYRLPHLRYNDWTGSSPLARGLPGGVGLREERDRIIPARAGFTSRPRRTGRPGPDHPRSRGVY